MYALEYTKTTKVCTLGLDLKIIFDYKFSRNSVKKLRKLREKMVSF